MQKILYKDDVILIYGENLGFPFEGNKNLIVTKFNRYNQINNKIIYVGDEDYDIYHNIILMVKLTPKQQQFWQNLIKTHEF